MKLYGIPEDIVSNLVVEPQTIGQHEVIERVDGFSHPIKVVYIAELEETIVITAYPLKQGLKNEN